ncbi:MAG TPA: hypothetical protein VH440_08120, partial [Candidatus Limnocylindrales bacterium]
RLNTGITVVGKRANIPRGARIGRNVKIAGDVKTTDFATRVIKSGASVDSARPVTAAARLAAANRRAEQRAAVAGGGPRSRARTSGEPGAESGGSSAGASSGGGATTSSRPSAGTGHNGAGFPSPRGPVAAGGAQEH